VRDLFVAGGRLGCVAQLISSRSSRRVELLLFAFSRKELRAAADASRGFSDIAMDRTLGPEPEHWSHDGDLVLVACHAAEMREEPLPEAVTGRSGAGSAGASASNGSAGTTRLRASVPSITSAAADPVARQVPGSIWTPSQSAGGVAVRGCSSSALLACSKSVEVLVADVAQLRLYWHADALPAPRHSKQVGGSGDSPDVPASDVGTNGGIASSKGDRSRRPRASALIRSRG